MCLSHKVGLLQSPGDIKVGQQEGKITRTTDRCEGGLCKFHQGIQPMQSAATESGLFTFLPFSSPQPVPLSGQV